MPRYAVIDVGTNSVKFNVSDRRDDGTWQTIVDRAEITRLGEGLEKNRCDQQRCHVADSVGDCRHGG